MQPDKSTIAASMKSRLQDPKAAQQRERVRKSIAENKPLDAEPERDRIIRRMRAVTGLKDVSDKDLLSDRIVENEGLSGEARSGAERIQGKTADFMGVEFLDIARAAANSVARVIFADGRPEGSGFMISERLFLTNNHVIPSKEVGKGMLVEFEYELDTNGTPRQSSRFKLDPQAFFHTNSEDDLDFTIIAIGQRVSGGRELADFGYCPLSEAGDKHILGEYVNLIQHPEGDFKQVVLRENQLVTRLEHVLHYEADTEPGSSGSPVFNDQWEAVALHHWGEPFREVQYPDGRKVQRAVNEGIRISVIYKLLKIERDRRSGNEQVLLDQALNTESRRPSTLGEKLNRPTPVALISTPQPTPINQPATPAPLETPISKPKEPTVSNQPSNEHSLSITAGTVTWTIPIEISIRIPGIATSVVASTATAAAANATVSVEAGAEGAKVDPNYSNRSGYIRNFLPGGFVVPLPKLGEGIIDKAAVLKQPATDGEPYELKYQHFSIVMNKERRLAFFTATNVDGSTWQSVDRKSGTVRAGSEGAEASEKWHIDRRIDDDEQTNQSLYSGQHPFRLFDRGHLTRRQDPNWGTPQRAARANADTFHFTNCSPQASKFNQQAAHWHGLEDYVLENAKADREKIVVITGQVFQDDDPEFRFVKVPRKYFKVLVRVENEKLKATALIADQSPMLRRLPESLAEGFNDMNEVVKQAQTSIANIEKLTGLDFGDLRKHDTFAGGAESASETTEKEIADFSDINLG